VALKVGNLIKWITSHKSYEANGDVLVGLEPIYKYGVVVKRSEISPTHFVVAACDDARWYILDTRIDSIEIISGGSENG